MSITAPMKRHDPGRAGRLLMLGVLLLLALTAGASLAQVSGGTFKAKQSGQSLIKP